MSTKTINRRLVTAALALALAIALALPASARTADCLADYAGVIGPEEVVPGNLLVTRHAPGNDPLGTVCLIQGTVQGNVTVIDETDACRERPPFTVALVAGGTVEGNMRSTGNACVMVWLFDGDLVGGSGASTVGGNVIIGAPGNLGFLGNDVGAAVEGNVILEAAGSGLFANGASDTNRVDGHIICIGGAAAGGTGSGTETNWDGLDPEMDGTIGGKYLGC